MQISINWLREFVAVDRTPDELAEELTLSGLEVDGLEPAAPRFSGVVVAEILERSPHPDADRLSICRVTDGLAEHEIVCGAPNARPGIKVPFAPVGTELPDGLRIKAARIRGVESKGMLCSARELGLAEDSAGLMLLDPDARVGADLRQHLGLDDSILEIDLTANRGDCFSVLGIAREIAARHGLGPLEESVECIEPDVDAQFDFGLSDTIACPRFAGRVITGLNPSARSPDWLRERLRRGGLRPIHPVVDVTNYVMLEYGQPLHAYRLDRLQGPIDVRQAKRGESLVLLDGTALELDDDTLVIADHSGVIGLAGIMGGQSTAVDASTDAIFLESAFFAPNALQGRARRYGLHTDASVRFERGVDPSGQERAIERATALLKQIASGLAGPVFVAEDPAAVPPRPVIDVVAARIAARLGLELADEEIEQQLGGLGMDLTRKSAGWQVQPPSYRFDIAIEEDVTEELGRMIGYDRIPVSRARSDVVLGLAPESAVSTDALSDLLVARGYTEIVSYGFTDAALQAEILGDETAIRLANPLSQELGVLRRSLWPGLLKAVQLNLSRQASRCRLFETGTVFGPEPSRVDEVTCFSGVVLGARHPVHWDDQDSSTDFFDVKADLDAVLANWRLGNNFRYAPGMHPALNPSRASAILHGETTTGWLGELHPRLQKKFDIRVPVILFELNLATMPVPALPRYAQFSRFPSVRRDLAVIVDEAVAVADLTKVVTETLGGVLTRYEIFDLYRGSGVDTGRKSIGIGLILQDASRTLTDQETDEMIQRVVRRLEQELGARIRS